MEIFSAIPAELRLLREALFMGAGMLALYDCLRILRRILPHGIVWISAEDFLYWLVCGFRFFWRMCELNNGIIRFYVILAMALGAWLYYAGLSRPLMKYLSLFILFVKKRLKKVRKAVTIRIARVKKRGDRT